MQSRSAECTWSRDNFLVYLAPHQMSAKSDSSVFHFLRFSSLLSCPDKRSGPPVVPKEKLSTIKVRDFLERLPLFSVMSKDGQGHLLALAQREQFAGTGAEHLHIHVHRTSFSLRSEGVLPGDRING